jgi:hypothetical protein
MKPTGQTNGTTPTIANPASQGQDEPFWKINFLVLGAGVALIIILTKLTGLVAPQGWYFTFRDFLYQYTEHLKLPAILIKISFPLLAGILVGLFVEENPKGTAGAIGFLAAFIGAWPALNDWLLYAPPGLESKEYAFKIVYLLYMLSYFYLAILGTRITNIYLNWLAIHKKETRSDIISDILDWKKSVRPAILAIGTSLASFILGKLFAS